MFSIFSYLAVPLALPRLTKTASVPDFAALRAAQERKQAEVAAKTLRSLPADYVDALLEAARRGDLDAVNRLIESGRQQAKAAQKTLEATLSDAPQRAARIARAKTDAQSLKDFCDNLDRTVKHLKAGEVRAAEIYDRHVEDGLAEVRGIAVRFSLVKPLI